MKQHITPDDLNQLSEKGKERLREWWEPEYGDRLAFKPYGCRKLRERIYIEEMGYDIIDEVLGTTTIDANALPLLSIGQMIEYLDEHTEHAIEALAIDKGEHEWHVYWLVKNKPTIKSVELCDALWEAVKESLEI